MQKILTPALLVTLINQGYRYCFAKITAILGEGTTICIKLVPVRYVPLAGQLPDGYDACFKITEEPQTMANGAGNTIILVDFSEMYTYANNKDEKRKVLVLDDDIAVLEIMEVLMESEGFNTLVIDQTDDLCQLVRLYQPALILLDFSLKGINGGEWCARLKSDPKLATIPVVIYSAYSNKGIQKGTYGCDDFIAKPFDIEDLMGAVKAWTSRPVQQLNKSQIHPLQQYDNH